MAEKFEVWIEAERFIHNDLSNCAYDFRNRAQEKIESGQTDGVYHDMMAALVFCAFSVEAKVNFVGWRCLQSGWPERANLREKIELLNKVLSLDLSWGVEPWQTLLQLKRFRDTLAHGKPEVIDERKIVDVEPEIWAALKGQWESSVRPEFVAKCREAEQEVWTTLLSRADIPKSQTLTHGGHSLKQLIQPGT